MSPNSTLASAPSPALPLDQLLALDEMTLRAHTEAAGAVFSIVERRQQLLAAMQSGHHFILAQFNQQLVAYAHFVEKAQGDWFVLMLNIHPEFRKPKVLFALASSSVALFKQHGVGTLVSNVYRTNLASLSFHRRLGFSVGRENALGYEFVASVGQLTALGDMAARARETDTLSVRVLSQP